jgi:hypothetical protein
VILWQVSLCWVSIVLSVAVMSTYWVTLCWVLSLFRYAECSDCKDYAECQYAECRYAECRGAASRLLSIFILLPWFRKWIGYNPLKIFLANLHIVLPIHILYLKQRYPISMYEKTLAAWFKSNLLLNLQM